jgi:copper chaperone
MSIHRKERTMTDTTLLRVPDMSCGHCKAAVEGELNRLSGVEWANADVENGVVEVSYDEDRVTAGQLEGAIEEAGYTVAR